MARPTPASAKAVEVQRLDAAEAAMALAQSMVRRARLVATFVTGVSSGGTRLGTAATELLDGNESDLEELTLRWRLAGVRWPIVILLALAFLGGFSAGRRSGR